MLKRANQRGYKMKEIFDRVKTHLLEQGARARHSTGVCAYRAPNGLKCAVGCLITDEAYNDGLEGKNVKSGRVLPALIVSGISTDSTTLHMLTSLQSIHDREAPANWERELAHLEADLFGGAE